jgi:hypothetical protein
VAVAVVVAVVAAGSPVAGTAVAAVAGEIVPAGTMTAVSITAAATSAVLPIVAHLRDPILGSIAAGVECGWCR